MASPLSHFGQLEQMLCRTEARGMQDLEISKEAKISQLLDIEFKYYQPAAVPSPSSTGAEFFCSTCQPVILCPVQVAI